MSASSNPQITVTDSSQGPDYVTITMVGQEPLVVPSEAKFVADAIHVLNDRHGK